MQEQKQTKSKSHAKARALNPLSARGELRPCSWPGCADEGKFRAPKSRQNLQSYHWFCLDHVKAYNTSWNYYAGMSEAEVEADLRHDTVWQRPSWRWGTGGIPNEDMLRAAIAMYAFGPDGVDANPSPPYRRRAGAETETDKAMAVLGLKPPLTRSAVKARYKELAKRHHPDVAHTDQTSADKIRDINHAYKVLMDGFAA
ncbi:MAG: J domain-containing protein [Rhodospirillales bacterium]|nr:J domain-containing protein [Rhodospirillales bacterium]